MVLTLLGSSLIAACSGGGSGSSGPSVPATQAPSQLTYSRGVSLFIPGELVSVAAPSVAGDAVTSWSVSPPLPAGLSLSSTDGSISGLPSEAPGRVRYTVTASNAGGSTEGDFILNIAPPVHFALVTHQAEGVFGRYLVDSDMGELKHRGYVVQDAAEVAPEGMVVTPNGRFGFTTNSGSEDLTCYRIDADSGELAHAETVSLPSGDYSLAVHPSGTALYVAANGSSRLESYSIDPVSGQLSALGASLVTASQPEDIKVSPDGDYLILTHTTPAQLDSYALDPSDFAPSFHSSYDLAPGAPQTGGLAISPYGNHVYASFTNLDLLGHFEAEAGTGALTLIGTGIAAFPDIDPTAVSVHPNGNHVYVLNRASENLTRYAVDATTGGLTRAESLALPRAAAEFTIEPAGRYGYLVDDAGHSCLRVDLDPTTGLADLGASVRTRRVPGPVALVTGQGRLKLSSKNLYVTNSDSDDVSMFDVATDGSLTALTPNAPTGDLPDGIATDPRGRFAFVCNFIDSTITRYLIELDGSLTEMLPVQPCGPSPSSAVVDPSGRFLYVVATGDETLQVFSIADDGSLVLIETKSSGTQGSAITIDPSGQYLYIAIQGDRTAGNAGRIEIYGIDPQTGMLDRRSPNGAAPGGPSSLSFAPDGSMVYSTLFHADHLAPYRVSGEVGTLDPLSPGTPTGNEPMDIRIHPSGKFAYVAVRDAVGFGRIELYDVRPSDGALIDASTNGLTARASFSFLANPRAIEISPDGETVYALHAGPSRVAVMSVDDGLADPSLVGELTLESSAFTGADPVGLLLTTKLE